MPRAPRVAREWVPPGVGEAENGRIGVVAASGPRISVQFGGVRRASSPGPACGKMEGSVRLPRSAAGGWALRQLRRSEKGCSKPPARTTPGVPPRVEQCVQPGSRTRLRKMGALASCRQRELVEEQGARGGGLGVGLGAIVGSEHRASTSGGAPPRAARRGVVSRKLPRRLTTPAPRRAHGLSRLRDGPSRAASVCQSW